MRIHQLLTVIVIAVGAPSIGCMTNDGAPSSTDSDTSSQASALTAPGAKPNQSTGVRCSNEDWQITFWAEPAMITPVGTMTCSCWQLEDLEGQESNWSSLNYEDTCDSN
jgi:hypothetical protein